MAALVFKKSIWSQTPFVALALLFLGAVPFVEGTTNERMLIVGLSVLLLGASVASFRATLTLDGDTLTYTGPFRPWTIDLDKVESVDAPVHYQLVYVTLRESGTVGRQVGILDYAERRQLAALLLERIPSELITPPALAVLEGVHAGDSGDQLTRRRGLGPRRSR